MNHPINYTSPPSGAFIHSLRALFAGLLLCLLSACGSIEPATYAQEKPVLDLQQYFNGKLQAHGMFQDRSGKVIKRFEVDMDCQWQGEVGTLDERFVYSDGTRQRRVWTLRKTGPNTVTGTADDVIGEARGEIAGNALHWSYVLALPVDGKVYNVNFDDWMYLMTDRVMLNRAAMSKFGLHLGDVTLSFYKQ